MIAYNIQEIIDILNAENISKGNENAFIRTVETDSRYISNPEESLFLHSMGYIPQGIFSFLNWWKKESAFL